MKSIFAVMAQGNLTLVGEAIQREFPDNHLMLAPGQWLIAAAGTAQEVSDQIGLKPGFQGSAVVIAASGYYGLGPTPVWEWIKTKWGSA